MVTCKIPYSVCFVVLCCYSTTMATDVSNDVPETCDGLLEDVFVEAFVEDI